MVAGVVAVSILNSIALAITRSVGIVMIMMIITITIIVTTIVRAISTLIDSHCHLCHNQLNVDQTKPPGLAN